jgi:hypothetical protein
MASVYHIVAIRVNETSWAHVWRLCFRYLRTGYDTEMRDGRLTYKAMLKRSQIQDRAQQSSIGDMQC